MPTHVALWLNLFSQGVLVFFISLVAIAGLWRLVRFRWVADVIHKGDCESQRWLLWGAVLAPWVITALAVFLLATPRVFIPEGRLTELLHAHHLYYFSGYSWHTISLLISILLALLLFGRACFSALQHVRLSHRSETLFSLSNHRLSQNSSSNSNLSYRNPCYHNNRGDNPSRSAIRYFDHQLPLAYTAGLLQPRAYISRTLAEHLDTEELTIIQRHEQAHIRRYDPLQKCLYLFFSSFYPGAAGKQLIEHMNIVMEYSADQRVLKMHNVLKVAETLLKVSRLFRRESRGEEGLSCHYLTGITQLERRIHYLLADKAKAWPLWIALLLQFFIPAVVALLSLDFVHHRLDDVLWH